MSFALVLRPAAEQDIEDSITWYERRQAGLGERFLDSVEQLFVQIEATPLQFPVVRRNVRRALTQRFPHAAYFLVEDDEIVVLAVLHQHQNPATWLGRM